MILAEVAHLVEHQPSKLRVAGSSPVFRSLVIPRHSFYCKPDRRCSSVVEHFLGKEEVGGSIPPIGSVTATNAKY